LAAVRVALRAPIEQGLAMIELVKTSDAVRLSFLRAVLKDAGIETAVFDAGAGSLWGTAITSRLMVEEDDLNQAKRIIAEAERQLGD
jgi:Putative prokaryotic signal transducing protein